MGVLSGNNRIAPEIEEWIVHSLGTGTAIKSVERLPGATSSSVYRTVVDRSGCSLRLVLRLFTNQGWLTEEPDLALHEVEALKKALSAGLPTPEPVAYDETGAYCGVPAVLMTELPGKVELNPPDLDVWVHMLAEALSSIHAVKVGSYPWRYFRWDDVSNLEPPNWSRSPELWEMAIEMASQPEPQAPDCFLHRDYHPTNVLWQSSRVSGVVDWVNACRGPACVDLAHCRRNLVTMYGVEVADKFLHDYQSLLFSFDYNPYWDVVSAVCALPEPGIYPPWAEFGLKGLDTGIIKRRSDEYLISIMKRLL